MEWQKLSPAQDAADGGEAVPFDVLRALLNARQAASQTVRALNAAAEARDQCDGPTAVMKLLSSGAATTTNGRFSAEFSNIHSFHRSEDHA